MLFEQTGWNPFNRKSIRQRFRGLIADPAWPFDDALTMSGTPRGVEANYASMAVEDIAALPVAQIAADNALLGMWCPSALLAEGLYVMKAWGFDLKGTFVWVKTTKAGWLPADDTDLVYYDGDPSKTGLAFGMGHTFRQCHELALIGARGSVQVASRSERSVCTAYNTGHSVKPDILHERIERLIPGGPYIELFARRRYLGWTTVGNEIDGRDIRHALPDLICER